MEITINEVKRITELTKKVNCTSYAMIAEIAKEMGVKKTALMQFIEDNPKLFSTGTVYKYIKNKKEAIGLAIEAAYLTPEENPDTDEWLEVMKKKWEKKIHISGKYYYNQLEFYFVDVDTENTGHRTGGYRNTKEKIEELEKAGVITKSKCGYGGLSDYYTMETYRITDEVRKAIEDYGWTTDFEEILKK